MRRTAFRTRFDLISITVAGMALLAAPEAKSQTSMVQDSEGDAFFSAFVEPQEYLDLTSATITLETGIFVFNFTVAASVPDEPFVPQTEGRNGLTVWQFVIDTDPTTFPSGFPLQPNAARAPEFLVQFVWDGDAFNSVLIDRQPLLSGEDAIVTAIPFSIYANELSASVSDQMLGNPESFDWFGLTEVLPGGYGYSSFLPVDFAPDNDLATWSGE